LVFSLGFGQCFGGIMDPESEDFNILSNNDLVTGPDILFL
jgi:hypothetical protein